MKEKNLARKIAMKKRREAIVRKKKLHKDIASFMVDYWTLQVKSPIAFAESLLRDGFYGYDRMRGSDIMKQFDEVYRNLKDKKHSLVFHYKRQNPEYEGERKLLGATDTADERTRLTSEAEVLMGRLMELAFNLDFEE